ncbi:hypothetical protein [Krasilnikovia sp. M28-CT-15]|uniref:hypothetical protein n=1 Tax=Krasilnikovia sp. M28-CT-15 TaxID=3373540 RepID=UPI0038775502
MDRCHWFDLPLDVQGAVREHTGDLERVEPVAAGSFADMAVILRTAGRPVFCKATRADNPRAWVLRNEARLNGVLPRSVVPHLRWEVETGDWHVLGFDVADGRHADLAPNSPDLTRIAATLEHLSALLTPSPTDRVQPATARWAGRVAPELVDGDTLLHTDVTARNFIIGSAVFVVDWSTPCRGAVWIDTALMVVRLIRAGHTPGQAERWAASVPMWQTADPAALDAFSAALAKLYTQRCQESPAQHRRELSAAARSWAAHRSPAWPRSALRLPTS